MFVRRLIAHVIAGVAVATMAVALPMAPAQATPWPDIVPPLAINMPNPGLMQAPVTLPDGTTEVRWVDMMTGDPLKVNKIMTSRELTGPWESTGTTLLTRHPNWMATTGAIWAASAIRAIDGSHYVAFYSGVVRGVVGSRCIGTAISTNPIGPYEPNDSPIACWQDSGVGAQDEIPKAAPDRKITLIDPTPVLLGNEMVLTYKTAQYLDDSARPLWRTAQRMIKLNPYKPAEAIPNPATGSVSSMLMSDVIDYRIEENPTLTERKGTYTLFTSWGFFGQCDYYTRYRQNTSLWSGWLDQEPTNLPMPVREPTPEHPEGKMLTCGSGNEQIVKLGPNGPWRLAFNGHPDIETLDGPDGWYVGNIVWDKEGRPRMTALLS